jgi:glutamate dehydrogenase/leucine dehydrogenase
MKDLLKKYESKHPEIVFEWRDTETEAVGWVVINSLRGGAAGGGTRMRKGLDRNEVESLAKTMEVKFTVSGPQIGGAKSGINFDPSDPRKAGVLRRWYRVVCPLLKNYYGTGGDLNVDEIHEVIPITEAFGLWHPQEGIVSGHYQATDPQKVKKLGQLRQGVSKIIEDPDFSPATDRRRLRYTVSDMITGYGVAESVKHYYQLWHDSRLLGKRVIIQGWGNVASAAGWFLSEAGAKIVGIIDKNGAILSEEGLDMDEVQTLFLQKKNNTLNIENTSLKGSYGIEILSFEEANEKIWSMGADIFIPAAASRLVTKEQVEKMQKNGLEVISCGANVPFKDVDIFYGETMEFADNHVSVIPDFVANCGMARVFAYLMTDNVSLTDKHIFQDVSKIIEEALKQAHLENPHKTLISNTLYQIALSKLIEIPEAAIMVS